MFDITIRCILWLLVLAVVVPSTLMLMQALLALLPWPVQRPVARTGLVSCAVLIPAHNEEEQIEKSVRSVLARGDDQLRVLVIADNCSDRTAERAVQAGAEVIQRTDMERRGKAFALGFATNHLAANPPEVVVIMDADCVVGPAGFRSLAQRAVSLNRPVQSLNLADRGMSKRDASGLTVLGNRWQNLVRPLGLAKLGLPCLLQGSGMAIPWHLVASIGLENQSLGEDKQLGIEMSLAGYPPIFSLDTKTSSALPDRYAGFIGQRIRWEHGHLLVALSQIPRLVIQGVRQGRLSLLVMACDLVVPPIAMLGSLWCLAAIATTAWGGVTGIWTLALIVAFAAGMLVTTLLITWRRFARRHVSLSTLALIPWYIARKIPIYLHLIAHGPEKKWLRTERASEI